VRAFIFKERSMIEIFRPALPALAKFDPFDLEVDGVALVG
jgi:hypothetical protein